MEGLSFAEAHQSLAGERPGARSDPLGSDDCPSCATISGEDGAPVAVPRRRALKRRPTRLPPTAPISR